MDEFRLEQDFQWPFLIYVLLAFLLSSVMIFLSYFLGEKHKETSTEEIFESGVSVTGDARTRFPVDFYIIAMFFVIFDLESVFIISWAVSVKESGWTGYIGVLIFIVILLAVLIYEWRTGALDFGLKGKHILNAYKKLQNRTKNGNSTVK